MEFNINYITIILIATFGISFSIQLFYYLYFFVRLLKKDKSTKSEEKPPVSVVICAQNEYDNLKAFLPKILEQNYPNFEVIVVNDASYDDTEFILQHLEKQYKNLRHTTIKPSKFKHGKKLALTIGIKSAKYEHLVLTDADCFPENKNWITNIIKAYSEDIDIVISYGAYVKEKTILNKFIRYDNVFNSINFLSFALAKIPYMGTGRNLSYKKSLFTQTKGFASHYGILSGDDDLFVNENATKNNVATLYSPENFTYTKAKNSFSDWYFQKIRHLSASKKYKLSHKILLSIEPITRTIFYLSLIISIILTCKIVLFISLITILIKIILKYFILNLLQERDLLLTSLIYDIVSPLLYFIIHINKQLKKQQEWN